MEIIFRNKTGNKSLDSLNDLLYKNSKGRFELRRTKDYWRWYMIDFDETGKNRIIRNYDEIGDILECMHIEIINLHYAVSINWKEKECN